MHFKKAPIVEAVLDIQMETALVDFGALQSGFEGLDGYSALKPKMAFQAQFNVAQPDKSIVDAPHQIGLVCTGTKQSLHLGLKSFTFSQLPPYETWGVFCDEARDHWRRYKEIACPSKITRISVRYVNRLDLPWPFDDFKEFLKTCPEVSVDLPQKLNGFFMSMNMPFEDPGITLILQQALVPPAAPDVVSVILDIDILTTENLSLVEEALWARFEELRQNKNRVFLGCITEKAKELFN